MPSVIDDKTEFQFTFRQLAFIAGLLAAGVGAYLKLEFRQERSEEKITEIHESVREVITEVKGFRSEWEPRLNKK